MKVLFIYHFEFHEPLGIMQLSAFLKQHGHACYFIDLALQKDYAAEIKKICPDIIAYSLTTGTHSFYQMFNRRLKKQMDFVSVFGGPHATFFPEFIDEDGVDVVCIGEGEYPLLELADALEGGRDYTAIANLWVKRKSDIHRNEVRPLIGNLDTLPFADRELVNKYAHYRKMHGRIMLSGRGCPYSCAYCFNESYRQLYKGKGAVVRKRSVENVILELKAVLEKYRPWRFKFVDDIFILDTQWCLEFCARYAKEVRIPFFIHTRLNLLTEEVVSGLQRAGCMSMMFAIESGNDYIRNKVLQRNMSEAQIVQGARLLRQYGIKAQSNNMVGIPDETLEMAFETIRLNIRCKPDYAWCSLLRPFPRTRIWQYCKDKNYLGTQEAGETFYRKSTLRILKRRQFENLHHLFSLMVAFPVLLRFARPLINLPLGRAYYFIWHAHRLWCYVFKIRHLDISDLFIREEKQARYAN